MFYMLTGLYTHKDYSDLEDLQKRITTIPINLDCIKNPATKQILSAMLQIDQTKRATLDEIIHSDWVSNYGEEKLDLDHQEEDDHSVSDFGNIDRLINTN